MKKTLAAVLAAAMALSTATVAFAADNDAGTPTLGGGNTLDSNIAIFGKEYKQYLKTDDFSTEQLGQWLDDNIIKIDVIVTEGRSSFETVPTVSAVTLKDGSPTDEIETKTLYRWKSNVMTADGKKVKYHEGKTVTELPAIYDAGNSTSTVKKYKYATDLNDEGVVYIKDNNAHWTEVLTDAMSKANDAVEAYSDSTVKPGTQKKKMGAQVKYKVRHTYGTSEPTLKMKFKITFKKSDEDGLYKKGDTYTTDEYELKAKYNEITGYSKDIVITLDEVKVDNGCNVIIKGDKLYDEVGNENFTIQFEDTAIFEAKLSSSQKKLNLFYNLDENTDITSAYPNVDFEFITFKGAPSVTSFVNTGKMTFTAIGGKHTQVYRLETAGGGDNGDTLVPLDGEYDPSYGTITVKGIKNLSGTFVVASEILEVEDDEDNEPVDSAPVVEEPSSSQPADNSGDRNPSTGAC